MTKEAILLLIVLPLGLAAFCGVLQCLAAVKADYMLPVLFILTGGAVLVCLLGASLKLGMKQIGWMVALLWTGSALAGSLLGWSAGWLIERRKERGIK